jgi:hypothetical protein
MGCRYYDSCEVREKLPLACSSDYSGCPTAAAQMRGERLHLGLQELQIKLKRIYIGDLELMPSTEETKRKLREEKMELAELVERQKALQEAASAA